MRIALNYLKELSGPLTLKQLTLKTCMLLALVTCQRRQTLQAIRVSNIKISDKSVVIKIDRLLKQSRPGHHLHDIVIPAFEQDRRICPCDVLGQYLKRTESIRSNASLFISWIKPHQSVSLDTISRWIELVLKEAGINLELLTAHSVRGASSSAALGSGAPLDLILRTAGWSNCKTFMKHYHNPVVNHPTDVSTALLSLVE